VANGSDFRHLFLRLVADAPPKKQKPRGIGIHPETEANKKERRQDHGGRLFQASSQVLNEWLRIKQLRQQERLPEIPEAVSLFLRVDPKSIAVEELRKFDIEVIGEFEDGYILGASADTSLSKLRTKIMKFMDGQQHQVAGLWEIITEMRRRLENVLWLNWKTNRLNQPVEDFIRETIELAASEDLVQEEKKQERQKGTSIPWMIRERQDHGQVKGMNRQTGTVQKDWAVVKAYELPETLCIAVIGHIGWKNNMDAQVPYSLVVSFEAVNEDVEIYVPMAVENMVEIETRAIN